MRTTSEPGNRDEMPTTLLFDVNGLAIAVRTWQAASNERPAVVLLPGTGETADDWDTVAAVLSQTRMVLAVDLRGHGASDQPGSTRSS